MAHDQTKLDVSFPFRLTIDMDNRLLVTNDPAQCHRREETEVHDATSHRYSTMPDGVTADGPVGMFGLCLSL